MSVIICYSAAVSFDVARAVTESFGSRTPFLDRFLSYLFFADLAVIEQSTADAWGSGVTVIGVKGESFCKRTLAFACCLPSTPHVPYPSNSAHSVSNIHDMFRVVDLFARLAAVSAFKELRELRLALVAYRPDPIAATLDDVALSPLLSGADWVLSVPTGLALEPVPAPTAIVEVSFEAPSCRPRPRRRVRDIVLAEASSASYDPELPSKALRALLQTSDKGKVEVLEVLPFSGIDLLAPLSIQAVIGLHEIPPKLEAPWTISGQSRPAVIVRKWSEIMAAIVSVLDTISKIVEDIWEATQKSPRVGFVRLLSLRESADVINAVFAVEVPSVDSFSVLKTRLESACPSNISMDFHVPAIYSFRVYAMGPSTDKVLKAPAEAAREAAAAYLRLIADFAYKGAFKCG